MGGRQSLIFTGSNNPLVLIHSDMYYHKETEVIDILLSPQFYTHKREYLDIKYLYKAKKLAPSILENLLPHGEEYEYEYYVYKDGDSWVFIAYNITQISDFLESKGISIDQVSKLYFAQQVQDMFRSPLSLNEEKALSTLQKSVTVVPKSLLSPTIRYTRFDDSYRPASGISFGAGVDSVFTQKEAWIMGAIFVLFGLLFVAEGLRFDSITSDTEQRMSLLFEEYPSLQSTYARANIIKKYHKIDKIERDKREILKEFSRLVLPGVEVDTLSVNSKKLSITLQCPDQKSILRVTALARAKKYQIKKAKKDNLLTIETSL